MVYISLVFWIARSLFSESNCQIGGMLDSVRGISNSTVIEVVFYGMFLLDSVRGIYSSCFLEWSVSVFRLQLSDLWYVRFSSRYIQFNCYSSFLWYVSVRFSSWYIFLFFCIDWSLFSMSNCQIGGMLDSVRGIFSSTVIEVVLYKVHNISLLFFGLACLCFPCPSVSITEN
jgi:hypothetical protein